MKIVIFVHVTMTIVKASLGRASAVQGKGQKCRFEDKSVSRTFTMSFIFYLLLIFGPNPLARALAQDHMDQDDFPSQELQDEPNIFPSLRRGLISEPIQPFHLRRVFLKEEMKSEEKTEKLVEDNVTEENDVEVTNEFGGYINEATIGNENDVTKENEVNLTQENVNGIDVTKGYGDDVTKENEFHLIPKENGVDVTKENGVEVYVTKDFGISRSNQEVSIAIGEGSDENIVEMDTAMMDQSSADGGEGL